MASVPTHDQLLNPTLEALRKLGGSAFITELVEQVVEDLQLPQDAVEARHSGRNNMTQLEYRLTWSRSYLKKYGLITNPARGVWALTPEGHDVDTVDPRAVVRFVHEQSRRERQGRTEALEIDERRTEPDTGEVEIASWRETLMGTLLEMQPDAFERL